MNQCITSDQKNVYTLFKNATKCSNDKVISTCGSMKVCLIDYCSF